MCQIYLGGTHYYSLNIYRSLDATETREAKNYNLNIQYTRRYIGNHLMNKHLIFSSRSVPNYWIGDLFWRTCVSALDGCMSHSTRRSNGHKASLACRVSHPWNTKNEIREEGEKKCYYLYRHMHIVHLLFVYRLYSRMSEQGDTWRMETHTYVRRDWSWR